MRDGSLLVVTGLVIKGVFGDRLSLAQEKVVTCSHKLGRRPPRPVGAVLTLLMVGVGVSLLFVNGSLPSC